MKMLNLLIIFIFSVTSVANAVTPGVIKKNNEAVKLLESDKNYEAYKALTDGLVEAPFQDELHLNLGYAFEKNKDAEKALAEYLNIAKQSKVPAYRFQALFNAARIKGEAKKIDDALNLYQQALEINPESVETKTNIELLLATGGGGGEGENDQKDKEGKDKENKDGQGDKPEQKPKEQAKPTPRPFDSKELTPQDVKNILDELKRQENQIRAKEYDKKPKESKSGKDW